MISSVWPNSRLRKGASSAKVNREKTIVNRLKKIFNAAYTQ